MVSKAEKNKNPVFFRNKVYRRNENTLLYFRKCTYVYQSHTHLNILSCCQQREEMKQANVLVALSENNSLESKEF